MAANPGSASITCLPEAGGDEGLHVDAKEPLRAEKSSVYEVALAGASTRKSVLDKRGTTFFRLDAPAVCVFLMPRWR